METKKLDVVECLDKDDLAWLDEGVLEYLKNNNKYYFDVELLHAHSLEYILEENLVGKFLVQHGFMQKCGWCDTFDQWCYRHNYKTRWSTIIIWMMGGRRYGLRPISNSLNAINTLSNI